ncbi:hypothetical protein DFP74_1425 [Nocardiopsis sp. Huas11]|uniref:hypothetical protein n=1 Tax=Nocardiopsis sp. Huas11 TaxID=2183912 RepID=UPI000EAEFCA9|nr:hypothetical protein [Nocardiopsis sp. Huas11]RKS05813.1 hypothetical protein DFP74_1425 [Nocardiopsis sp. Huas11]
MSQVTWRADGELVQRVRRTAERRGVSMNEYVTRVLRAATTPDLEGDEAHAMRSELAQAGLLDFSAAPAAPSRGRRITDRLRGKGDVPFTKEQRMALARGGDDDE